MRKETDSIFFVQENLEMPEPEGLPIVEKCRVVITKDSSGSVTGNIIEVTNNRLGLKQNIDVETEEKGKETTVYLSTVLPGKIKGYHGHTFRTSTYTLIQGQGEIHALNPYTGDLLIYEIDADKIPYRMIVGPGYHLALVSRNNKLAIFIGTPNPPFNYRIKEQIDIDPKIVEQRIKEGLIKIKRFSCTEEGVNPI